VFVVLHDGFETVNLTCTEYKCIILLSTTLNYNNIYVCDLSRRPVQDFFRRRRRCYFIKILTLAHDFTFFWSRSRYLYCLIIIYATSFRRQNFETSVYYILSCSLVNRRYTTIYRRYITIYRSTLDHGRYLRLKRKISCWIRDAYDRTKIIICVTQYSVYYATYLCGVLYEHTSCAALIL